MGTSFVAISLFWAANVSEIVTISVFTTGGWGGRRGEGKGGKEGEVRGRRRRLVHLNPIPLRGGRHVADLCSSTLHFRLNSIQANASIKRQICAEKPNQPGLSILSDNVALKGK